MEDVVDRFNGLKERDVIREGVDTRLVALGLLILFAGLRGFLVVGMDRSLMSKTCEDLTWMMLRDILVDS